MTTPEQHISELRTLTLTDGERAALRAKLYAYSLSYIPAHSLPARAWQWVGRHSVSALSLLVVLVAGGTGVSAHWAGPGDALYEFRLSVNDRVETVLTFDDESQIDIEMRQMQRMIDGEDALRDEELSDVAFAEDDATVEQESETEDVPTKTPRPTSSNSPHEEVQEDAPESFDDGSFDRELRALEVELRAEQRAGLELEN